MAEYISRYQAQKVLGCDKNTMLKLIFSGEIESSRKENGGWLVSRQSLDNYLDRKSDKEVLIIELQRTIHLLQEENRILKFLLKENAIEYDGIVIHIEPTMSKATTIMDLGLHNRALRSLYLSGIHTIEQLQKMSMEDLMKINGVGKKTATMIISRLQRKYSEPSHTQE